MTGRTTTPTTWDSQLSLDDRASIDLALRCTYDIETLCNSMLEQVRGETPSSGTPLVATLRMNAARIMDLNSVLMSLLDEDGTNLRQAYMALYGVQAPEGAKP